MQLDDDYMLARLGDPRLVGASSRLVKKTEAGRLGFQVINRDPLPLPFLSGALLGLIVASESTIKLRRKR